MKNQLVYVKVRNGEVTVSMLLDVDDRMPSSSLISPFMLLSNVTQVNEYFRFQLVTLKS